MKELNYEDDIYIDDQALDLEWLNQPSLMLRYTRHAAECRLRVDQGKQNIDVVYAELDKEIRENPKDYGLTKITDAAVKAIILAHDDYRDANEEYLNDKLELDMAQGAVRAIEQRKEALENLVRLFGLDYFAGPKTIRELGDKRREWNRDKEQSANISGKLNRKRRTS